MPSEQDIAPHVEELTRALDDVPEEKIRQELKRWLDHGVPIHQAKKDLLTSLGGGRRQVQKKVKGISANDSSVDLVARVISVDSREVTAQGRQTTLWEGELADETGRVAYTAWRDVGLEPDTVVEISNAYVRTWQGSPQVNIGDNAEVAEAPDDAVPPLDQLPTETVTTAPAGGGKAEIADLEPGMSSVTVEGRLLSVSDRTVNVQGEPKTIWEGELADETGRISYTSWHDHELQVGEVLEIENAYVRSFRGAPTLNFGENSAVERREDDALPPASQLEDKEAPAITGDEYAVKELRPGLSSVIVEGRLLSVRSRNVEVKGEPRTLWEGELADGTGRISYTAWHDHKLEEGQVVRIENAYVRSFRGLASLNFGENSNVTGLDDDAVPPMRELKKTKPYTLDELEQVGGALGVRVRAVVLEVRDGSGLILRCPECRRVLQNRECRLHGRVEGTSDLRIKAVIDDGTGAVTAFFDRSLTEEVLGKDLEACQRTAEEAMSREVIKDEIQELLLLKRVVLEGNATHDDYGTQLLVDTYALDELEDAADRAEELIDRIHVLSEEVVA